MLSHFLHAGQLRCFVVALFACALLVLGGCGSQDEPVVQSRAEGVDKADKLTFGMLIDSSGLGDQGYIDMQYKGLVLGCKLHQADFRIAQLSKRKTFDSMVAALESLAKAGCKAVFCTSHTMRDAMLVVARNYPDTAFVVMDARLTGAPPNAAAAYFQVGEAAYMAGFLSAKMSKTKIVGLIGGMDIPIIHEFMDAFSAGARGANEQVGIVTGYIHDEDSKTIPWNNPVVASNIADRMASEMEADIFFPVAGASAIGVYHYVKQRDLYAIGVDSDQDFFAKGSVLTSVMKRVDMAVEQMLGAVAEGRFKGGTHIYNLANGGVGLSPMLYTRHLIPRAVLDEMETVRLGIIEGQVVVPTSVPSLEQAGES